MNSFPIMIGQLGLVCMTNRPEDEKKASEKTNKQDTLLIKDQ